MATYKEEVAFQRVLLADSWWATADTRDGFAVIEIVRRHGAEWWLRVRESKNGERSKVTSNTPLVKMPAAYAGTSGLKANPCLSSTLAFWQVREAEEVIGQLRIRRPHGLRRGRRWTTSVGYIAATARVLRDNAAQGFEQTRLDGAEEDFTSAHPLDD